MRLTLVVLFVLLYMYTNLLLPPLKPSSSPPPDLYHSETTLTAQITDSTQDLVLGNLISDTNIQVNIGLQSLAIVLNQHEAAIMMIESMLYDQLNKAVGKHVTPHDFNEYMEFHYRQLLQKQFRPKGFACSIRQPMSSPVGELSIVNATEGSRPAFDEFYERELAALNKKYYGVVPKSFLVALEKKCGTKKRMVLTAINTIQVTRAMDSRVAVNGVRFPLNSSVDIHMNGTQTLHAFVAHQFQGARPPSLKIEARARQFSSYILLLGRYPSPDLFLPEAAIIIRNKGRHWCGVV